MTAIILAGGRSSRMGTPKALLDFAGEPLICRVVARLRPLFAEIVIVAAPGQHLPALPARVVHDVEAYQGPVGGISYGLDAATSESAFVMSCDAPFASTALISHLVNRLVDVDVVVPRWDGRLQPLFAVYRRSVLPLLQEQLARGELRPVWLFDKVKTLVVEADEIRCLDPEGDSFINMNTPEEYAAALRRWNAASIACTVELFGVARLLAQSRVVPLNVGRDATFSDVFAALATKVPVLAGRVIVRDGTRLADGYACNVNGLRFVSDPAARVAAGDEIAILSADAGG